jgi:hypothetical protein
MAKPNGESQWLKVMAKPSGEIQWLKIMVKHNE